MLRTLIPDCISRSWKSQAAQSWPSDLTPRPNAGATIGTDHSMVTPLCRKPAERPPLKPPYMKGSNENEKLTQRGSSPLFW